MSTHKPAQFTSGPWTQDGLFIVTENGDVPVPICDCDVENFLDVAQANATLIAAAPAMYEALREIDDQLDQFTVKAQEDLGLRGALLRIRDALAQAEGR